MDEYSIVTFLANLADDDLEKELLELIAQGLGEEELLDTIVEVLGRKQK
jgi:hypothetical protein